MAEFIGDLNLVSDSYIYCKIFVKGLKKYKSRLKLFTFLINIASFLCKPLKIEIKVSAKLKEDKNKCV